jgi:hypothetical protein
MPPKQLQAVLNAEWGAAGAARFRRSTCAPLPPPRSGRSTGPRRWTVAMLAIKVQYPGVRASIDSDVDNIATLMRLPGLLPRGDGPRAPAARGQGQLHDEADYTAEAAHLRRFGACWRGPILRRARRCRMT